jgi:GntR family transcriptional regulator / MocR family aminotransferase
MQALAPEHVVYAGTASKSLAPGLRLGWLVLPERLLADTAEAKGLAGGPSSVDQLTMAEFITSGAYDRHVRRSRLVYRGRRDKLVAALQGHPHEVRVAGIVAGLHVVVELPTGQSEDDVVARARERGLRVEGLASYKAAGAAGAADEHRPALVVGYATPPEHAFDGAIATLCAVLEETSG